MLRCAPNNLRLCPYDPENLNDALADLPCGTCFKRGSFLGPTVVGGKVFVGFDGAG